MKRPLWITPVLAWSLRVLEETCGGSGDILGSYLGIRDLGEDGWEALEQQHSSPAPQKQQGWTQRLIPDHFLPLSLPTLTLPPLGFLLCLSLGLSACTCALHLTGPQWPWVINGLYGAGASFPCTFVCCSVSPTPVALQDAQRHRCSPLQAA